MKRKEAIEILERKRDFERQMEKGWSEVSLEGSHGLPDPRSVAENYRASADALDMAISALREKEEE